jgi:hypothetical protein
MKLSPFLRRLSASAFGFVFLLSSHAASAQTAAPEARIVQAVDNKQLLELKGNVHPLARAEFDQGAVSDAQPMNRMLLLLQRSEGQEAALRQFIDDQQSKSSPNYHKWLTPEEFGARFGIADEDLQLVLQWLSSQGFTNISVGPGRSVIEFSGTVAQVRSAFHTDIHHFRVGKEDHQANTADPKIPAALGPVVKGIVSLHNFPRKSHAKIKGQFRREAGKSGLTPLLTIPTSNGNFYGMGPGDFAIIYNSKPLISSGVDGTGQTIAVVGETNIKLQDVQKFRSMFGLPANFDASNIILNGEDPGITSLDEEGEADLDVEWAGATAPGATVKFVVSASTPASAGIDLSALYIVEHNLAAVMSESYGECEAGLGAAGNAFYNSLWQQAAAQGITVIVSAGDGGSAGCDDFNSESVATLGLAVSGLASTPYNVSLGGTDFDEVNKWTSFWSTTNDATGTSAKSYIPEIPWNESCAQIGLTGCGASAPSGSLNIVGGSGGQSKIYPKPAWQTGVTANDNHRDQPDVSLLASPGFNGTGYVYCQSDSVYSGNGVCDITNPSFLEFGVIGGTSASAPAFAGVMALVNHKQATASIPAPRQGNANYILYALAKKAGASCASSTTEAATCVFNDVVSGNSSLPTGQRGVGTNSVPCKGGTPNCSISVAPQNGVLVDPSHTTTEAWTVATGYDMATGLGTVNINNLATAWSTANTISTTTTLSMSQTTGITHGAENVPVSITVKANTGTGVPTGNVSLIAALSGGTTQGVDQFVLSNGAVTAAHTQNLPGGTYNVYAHYSGDGTNAPSDSAPIQVTVGTETSQTFIVIPQFDSQGNLLNGNATSVPYGSTYIIRMYVTDKNAVGSTTGAPSPTCDSVNLLTCPTGTISLTANGSGLDGIGGTFNLNSGGYTRDLTPTLAGGNYSLVAKYNGDSSYKPSTSATDNFTVTPAPGTQLIFINSPNSPLIGSNLTFTVMGIPGIGSGITATGSVSLFDGTALIAGPVPIACYYCAAGEPLNFTATLQATFPTGGDHTLTAKYTGDANYAAATSTSLVIHPLYPTTMAVTQSATTINYGDSVTITAKVTTNGKNPTITGNFTFYGSYTQIPSPVTGTVTTDASGNQILTASVTTVPQSSEVVQVNYSGDPNFEGAFNLTGLINVNIPDFSLTVPNSPFNVPTGQTGSMQINVMPATNSSSPVTLSCNGNLPVGYSCSLQPSTANLANGVAVPVTLTLSPGTGAAVVHNALQRKRSRFFLLPFGSDPFRWIGLLLALGGIFLVFCLAGRKRLSASFAFGALCFICFGIGCGGGGSASTGPPPPPPGPFATTTTLSVDSAKVAQGTQFMLTAKVTGQGHPSGTVNFYANGGWLGTGNLSSGSTTLASSLPFPGLYSITAQYAGDPNNLTSTSTGLSESVTGSTVFQLNGQTGSVYHSVNVTVTLQ